MPVAYGQPSPLFLWTQPCSFALECSGPGQRRRLTNAFSDPSRLFIRNLHYFSLISLLCCTSSHSSHPLDSSSPIFPFPLVTPRLQNLPWLPLAEGIRSKFRRFPIHNPYSTPSKLTFLCPTPPCTPPSSLPSPQHPAQPSPFCKLQFSDTRKSQQLERNLPSPKQNNGVLSKLCSKIQFSQC